MEQTIRDGCIAVCVEMQKSVFELAARYQREQSRHYYVTPTSYLELINAFKDLLGAKRDEVSTKKSRYDVGLDKIVSTENMVEGMQKELEQLKPFLKKTAEETAALMVVIEEKQKDASAMEEVVLKDAAVAE